MVGEQLLKANRGIADLKTHIMEMEDRLEARFDGIDKRLDGLSTDVAWIKNFLEGMAKEMTGA